MKESFTSPGAFYPFLGLFIKQRIYICNGFFFVGALTEKISTPNLMFYAYLNEQNQTKKDRKIFVKRENFNEIFDGTVNGLVYRSCLEITYEI